MKTKFTPIAMKCNKKQFKAIEPKLKENNFNVSNIGDFSRYPNLVNNAHGSEGHISNFTKDNLSHDRKYYKTWNEEIFLNACGIETEPAYTLNKEQINYLLEIDSVKETVLEWFPELKPKELEVGNWYKTEDGGCFYIKSNNSCYVGYGLLQDFGDWYCDWIIEYDSACGKSLSLLSPEEIQQALEKEAVKRYKKGEKVKGVLTGTISNIDFDIFTFYYDDNQLYCDGVQIFENGIWAEIIKDEIPSDIQELFVKYGKESVKNFCKDE